MNVKEYVSDVLCVPVTRIGNRLIVEGIEIVLDTRDHKFYPRLSQISHMTPRYLESSIRKSKVLSLRYMTEDDKAKIFGKADVTTSEYVVKAAEYFRRTYENKEEG